MVILETLSRTRLHNEAHFQFNTEIRHLVLEKTNAALITDSLYLVGQILSALRKQKHEVVLNG
jgi:hypothetical protein